MNTRDYFVTGRELRREFVMVRMNGLSADYSMHKIEDLRRDLDG